MQTWKYIYRSSDTLAQKSRDLAHKKRVVNSKATFFGLSLLLSGAIEFGSETFHVTQDLFWIFLDNILCFLVKVVDFWSLGYTVQWSNSCNLDEGSYVVTCLGWQGPMRHWCLQGPIWSLDLWWHAKYPRVQKRAFFLLQPPGDSYPRSLVRSGETRDCVTPTCSSSPSHVPCSYPALHVSSAWLACSAIFAPYGSRAARGIGARASSCTPSRVSAGERGSFSSCHPASSCWLLPPPRDLTPRACSSWDGLRSPYRCPDPEHAPSGWRIINFQTKEFRSSRW